MTAAKEEEEEKVISHCACCGCPFHDELEMYRSDKTFDFAVCKSCFDAIEKKKQWNGVEVKKFILLAL
jgi:hypothetical protein